jgi:voltage-dependent potassium channel beta subunit
MQGILARGGAKAMQYRRLGRSGLKVSELSLGSWVTYANQIDRKAAVETMAAARDAGINFFDNAEGYASGRSEEVMGQALRDLKWSRGSFVVSTKFFWGLEPGPNQKNTLNRKYLLGAIDGSLQRMQLDFVDLAYCHRPDPETPVGETVWAMHDIIARGKALYWGTSEWPAASIREACEFAERHHLHAPVVEQPQYNLFCRRRVEVEYAPLVREQGIGLTTWSPLASGLLTGKYRDGIPPGSRSTLPGYAFLQPGLTNPARNDIVGRLAGIARELGMSVAQMAVAWCTKNPAVSTVILGASGVQQIRENTAASDLAAKLDEAVMRQIEGTVGANYD